MSTRPVEPAAEDRTADPPNVGSLGAAVRLAGRLARPRIGWALAVLGAIVIVVAWIQAADELFVARQVPYLISGGLGGLGLIVLGGVLLTTNDLYQYAGRLDRLERKVDDIHRALVAAGEIEGLHPAELSAVVVLPSGTTFHRPGCPAVSGKVTESIPPAAAMEDGRTACKLCSPLDDAAPFNDGAMAH